MKISLIESCHVSVPLRETFWPTGIPEFREGIIDPMLPAENAQRPPSRVRDRGLR